MNRKEDEESSDGSEFSSTLNKYNSISNKWPNQFCIATTTKNYEAAFCKLYSLRF